MRISPRRAFLLLAAAVGLLIVSLSVFSVYKSRKVSLLNEYEYLMEDLQIIADDISSNLDAGDPEYYSFLETTAKVQAEGENFSYLLMDSTGVVISPEFMHGKKLVMKDIRPVETETPAYLAEVWGADCLVLRYHFPDRPLELAGVYDVKYLFADVRYTIASFLLVLALFFGLMLLVFWFFVIPAVERIMARKEQAERELMIAREIQEKALTREFPDDPHCEVSAVLRAMKEVGGDIYRCRLVGRKLYFVVGDVSDKGAAAAFVMFLISSTIHSRVGHGATLAGLMKEINRLLCDNPDYEMFCTLFLGAVDLDTLELEYCNAGHTRTLFDGDFLAQDPQLIVGIDSGFHYHTQRVQLKSGDRILVYTDGVTEARDENRVFFGEKRLRDWMQTRPAAESCAATCEALLDTIARFRGKAPQNDDIAVMCIKIL